MPDTTQLESFTSGEETAIDLPGIQRQLKALWQLAAQSENATASRIITRASLINLVAICPTESVRDHVSQVISELTGRHPCRAIVVLLDEEKTKPSMTATITAHCHLAGGGRKQVCCEQISIKATGAAIQQTASTVLSLLESDLPTVLWWNHNFLDHNELFSRFIGATDRVVFDTSVWPQPPPITRLSETIDNHRRCQFTDLSWTRLSSWRRLTADFFDDATVRPHLDRLQRVTIELGGGPGAALRGRMYGAWLASQLGWTVAELAGRLRLVSNCQSEVAEQGFLAVTIESDQAQFTIRKNWGESTATAAVTMAEACGLPRKRALWPTDDVSLLSDELDQNNCHTVYKRALELMT
jgi:glucose-6-phosphate dehydrogenase assembly protein OpcA